MKEWGPQKLLNLWTFFQLWLKQQDFHLWTNVLNQVMISNCVPKEKVWHHYLRYSFWTSIPWFIDCSALMFAISLYLIRGHSKDCDTFGPEPIWSPDFQSPTLCPPGQTIHIKWIPLDKWSKTNSVPMDKWSPINSVPIFPNPYSLSPWTNEIF